MAPRKNHHPEATDRLRALLLRFFLGSIVVNAAFGVWALLAGEFGQTEGKILATSLLISAATLSVLVNATPIQQRSLWPVPAAAATSAAAAFGLLIVLIWAEIDDDVPLKIMGTGLVLGAGGTLAGLMHLISLAPRDALVRLVNNVLIAALALTAIWGIWAETDQAWYARAIGVESVLVAATTLAIPVLWRFAARAEPSGPSTAVTSSADADERLLGSLVSDRIVSVEPTANLRIVVNHLIEQSVSMVVVMDSNSVAGVITDRDIVLAIHDGADLDEVRAAHIMSTSLVVASDQATVAEAAQLMSHHGVRHLLVQGDHGGIISAPDLLAAATLAEQ